MFIGRYISCDEQYIGLWGQHKYKQRVTFKKVGEGFLLDSLFADGYIYSFYFSNQAVPKSWIDKRLSPLHARVVILLQQLPFDAKIFLCGVDNLYISPNFTKVVLNESGNRVMIHGLCRPSQYIPKCIVQDAVTKK